MPDAERAAFTEWFDRRDGIRNAWTAWQARAALAPSPIPVVEAGGWMPIETAPKSSDFVLLVSQSGVFRMETGWFANNMLTAAREDGDECHYTHWHRLPEAPK